MAKRSILFSLLVALGLGAAGCSAPPPQDGTPDRPPLPKDVTLPIVFVHGFAGSAQQYQSQAQRFAANGYPADRIRAYEHDGAGRDIAAYVAGTDAFIDDVRAEFEVDKVFLVGHSRGTIVSSTYLQDATRAAKVAKYASLDGAGCGAAQAASIPCVAPTQATLPGQKHVEVATSAESFKQQYELFVGSAPAVVDIVPQPGPVKLNGRAVNFPANTGRAGAKLEIWELESATAMRATRRPLATFDIGEDGNWGPIEVSSSKYYEMNLVSDSGEQHFYAQRYLRNSNFVRLLSGGPDSPNRLNTNRSDKHAAIVAIRMREWGPTDTLEVTTETDDGVQTIDANTPDVGNNRISINLHDDTATPGVTSLAPLPWFPTQPFQTGVDVFMPAAEPPESTITLTNVPRGDVSRPQVLRVPNWASSGHLIMVMFSDFAQDGPATN
jgi:pimeloyl-ACP methyl ester carboxylesterase